LSLPRRLRQATRPLRRLRYNAGKMRFCC